MVARHFLVRCGDQHFPIHYDTNDGLEVLKIQIFSLTSIHPDDQKIVIDDSGVAVSDSSDLATISDDLRLLSLQDDADLRGAPVEPTDPGVSDEEFARMLQAEEEALYLQQYHATDDCRELHQRVRPHLSQVLMYEDPIRQEEARKSTPVDEIEENALVSLWKEGIKNPSKEHKDHAFLLQLLFWFKKSFRWVNAPACDGCGNATINEGMGTPIPSEAQYGASRVEIYRCKSCLKLTRFPRYNDPLKLLETRRGRCGEWANCFTLYCRAFGYESRLILDFTDHLWTECFTAFLGRWMHLDPCEGIYDKPLLYEEGWNKKLSYVISISKDGARDVTKRYTRKWHEVLSRRNMVESSVSAALSDIRSECRRGYSGGAISILEERDQLEEDELNSSTFHRLSNSSVSLPGRQSGSSDWRATRSELGVGESSSLSSSSCPSRLCVDDHVCNIFISLTFLLLDFQGNGLETSEVILSLGILKKLLLDLKSSSFRSRKAMISTFDGLQFFKKSGPFDEFLTTLALKKDDQQTGICVSLAGDPVIAPVQTAVSLPVAIDVLDEILEGLQIRNQSGEFTSTFSCLNRISSGTVVASGEELPFGISTSAFDGTRSYKWEEPNGAKGCWLIYKTANGIKHDLGSYELMSANDAPERDPMDWTVEGSEDEGQTWYTLDQQQSQLFEKRFQRKRYMVLSDRKSNAFRFKFTSVRDPKGQSRFQVGSIDLYARDH